MRKAGHDRCAKLRSGAERKRGRRAQAAGQAARRSHSTLEQPGLIDDPRQKHSEAMAALRQNSALLAPGSGTTSRAHRIPRWPLPEIRNCSSDANSAFAAQEAYNALRLCDAARRTLRAIPPSMRPTPTSHTRRPFEESRSRPLCETQERHVSEAQKRPLAAMPNSSAPRPGFIPNLT